MMLASAYINQPLNITKKTSNKYPKYAREKYHLKEDIIHLYITRENLSNTGEQMSTMIPKRNPPPTKKR